MMADERWWLRKPKWWQVCLCVIATVSIALTALAIVVHADASPGDTGQEVVVVQMLLVSHGYVLPVDGVFGNKTAKAVRHFQKSSGLLVDAIAGPVTLDALGYEGPPPPPTFSGDGPDVARSALVAGGANQEEADFGVMVCQRESHCTLGAHNYSAATRDDSWGPWQLNYYGSLGARMSTIGPKESNVSSWPSAVNNFLKLYRATGGCPWRKPNYCA